ncbi:transposase, partial [Mycobacterium tuberculosis UT0100]
SWRRLMSLAR